jgi:hypothetical protein
MATVPNRVRSVSTSARPAPVLKNSIMIPNLRVQQEKRRPERLLNQRVRTVSKTIPSIVERCVFHERRLTVYRLKAAT